MKKFFTFSLSMAVLLVATSEIAAMIVALPTTEVNYGKSIFSKSIDSCKDFAHPIRQKNGSAEFYIPVGNEPLLTERQYEDLFKGQTQIPIQFQSKLQQLFKSKYHSRKSIFTNAEMEMEISTIKDLLEEFKHKNCTIKEITEQLFIEMADEVPSCVYASLFLNLAQNNEAFYIDGIQYKTKSSSELAKILGIREQLEILYAAHKNNLPQTFQAVLDKKRLLGAEDYKTLLPILMKIGVPLHGYTETICKAVIDFLIFNLHNNKTIAELVRDILHPKTKSDLEALKKKTREEKCGKWLRLQNCAIHNLAYSPKQLLSGKYQCIQEQTTTPILDFSQIAMHQVYDARLSYCLNWDGNDNKTIDVFSSEFEKLLQTNTSLLYRLRDQNAIHSYMVINKFSPRQMADLLVHDLYVARNRCATHLTEEINKRLMALLTDRRSWITVVRKEKDLIKEEVFSRTMARLMFEGSVATYVKKFIPADIQINKPMSILFDEAKRVVATALKRSLSNNNTNDMSGMMFSGIVENTYREKIKNFLKFTNAYRIYDLDGTMKYMSEKPGFSMSMINTCFFNSSMPFYVRNRIHDGVRWIYSLEQSCNKYNALIGATFKDLMKSIGVNLLDGVTCLAFANNLLGTAIISIDEKTGSINTAGLSTYGPVIGINLYNNDHWKHMRYDPALDDARKKVDASWTIENILTDKSMYDFTKLPADRFFFNTQSIQTERTEEVKQKSPESAEKQYQFAWWEDFGANSYRPIIPFDDVRTKPVQSLVKSLKLTNE